MTSCAWFVSRAGHAWRIAGLSACLALGLAIPARAQPALIRFGVATTADSTFTFRVGASTWVGPGKTGLLVDPARQDALVARFLVLRVADGTAIGLITGQTTRVTTGHIALIAPPTRSWVHERVLWGVAAGGVLFGFLLGRVW